MKTFRIILWALIFVLGAFLAYHTIAWQFGGQDSQSNLGRADVGGPFTAQRTDGTPITRDDMLGRPHVLFFGFTHCPDICPTTLYEAGQWLKELGQDGDKVDVYFVTVDPERDTPQILKEYLTAFDPRISGISGSPAQINQISKAWRVFAQKEGDGEDYFVNHSATTFLMDANGKLVSTIAFGENSKTALVKLKKLVDRAN